MSIAVEYPLKCLYTNNVFRPVQILIIMFKKIYKIVMLHFFNAFSRHIVPKVVGTLCLPYLCIACRNTNNVLCKLFNVTENSFKSPVIFMIFLIDVQTLR